MRSPSRIALVNVGWSQFYSGDGVEGDHEFLRTNGWGAERYNFRKGPRSRYFGYVRPVSGYEVAPNPKDKDGWLIVFVSKRPAETGLRIVGWYERASFLSDYAPRPEYRRPGGFRLAPDGEPFPYVLESREGVLVPEALRSEKIKTKSLRRAAIMYLRGHGSSSPSKEALAKSVLRQMRSLEADIRADVPSAAPADRGGPISLDADRRKEVEDASMREAAAYYALRGFDEVKDVSRKKWGYDLHVRRSSGSGGKGPAELYVEVKGTQSSRPRFLMSRGERRFMDDPINERQWRLAMVTSALSKPKTVSLTRDALLERFDLSTFTWFGEKKR